MPRNEWLAAIDRLKRRPEGTKLPFTINEAVHFRLAAQLDKWLDGPDGYTACDLLDTTKSVLVLGVEEVPRTDSSNMFLLTREGFRRAPFPDGRPELITNNPRPQLHKVRGVAVVDLLSRVYGVPYEYIFATLSLSLDALASAPHDDLTSNEPRTQVAYVPIRKL